MQKVILISRALIKNKLGEVLFVKRSMDDRFDAGLWELPGGKLEENELLVEGLVREVFEESGYRVSVSSSPIKIIDEYNSSNPVYKGFLYLTLVFNGVTKSKSDQTSEYETAWVGYEEFLKDKKFFTSKTLELEEVIFDVRNSR